MLLLLFLFYTILLNNYNGSRLFLYCDVNMGKTLVILLVVLVSLASVQGMRKTTTHICNHDHGKKRFPGPTRTLKCKSGQVVKIYRAKYGAKKKLKNCVKKTSSRCSGEIVTKAVRKQCGTNQQCTISAADSKFSGVSKACKGIQKYLLITWYCK